MAEPGYQYCAHISLEHLSGVARGLTIGPTQRLLVCHACWAGIQAEVFGDIVSQAVSRHLRQEYEARRARSPKPAAAYKIDYSDPIEERDVESTDLRSDQ